MRIMVFDVPAVSGGALTILNKYYNEAVIHHDKDKIWYFVVSLPIYAETDTVKILRIPWVKKSWIHRLFFDTFVAPQLVKKYKIDEIISLQNMVVPRVNIKQTLYVHNSLPFINKKFKLLESPLFWAYQNIIGKKIINSIKKANQVIVQTNWMKDACVNRAKVTPKKIIVKPPEINIEIKQYFEPKEDHLRTFFYPASGFIYKNHKLIVDAALLLKKHGICDYNIIFTLKGDENKHISGLCKQIKQNNLPIKFVDTIPQKQVFDYYGRSILVFPSCIETIGLPMLEAKLHQTPILASDMPFSHEALDNYEKSYFFNPFNCNDLFVLMCKAIQGKMIIY